MYGSNQIKWDKGVVGDQEEFNDLAKWDYLSIIR